MILGKRAGRRGSVAVVAMLGLGALALSACGSGPSTSGVVNAVAAQTQYGDVIAQIGGSYVHVTSIMTNPNTDPHNFEASPSVAQALSGASLVVQNGDGYDAFMNQLESATSNTSRVVITVSSLRHTPDAANPHFWWDPTTMPLVARHVAQALERLAPAHAAYFRARAAMFVTSWRPVSVAVATARRRFSHYHVATTEPVGDYLLSSMGLVNLTPWRFQADVMNGVDPSPEDVATQQSLLARHRVNLLLYNSQVVSPVTSAIHDQAARDGVATVAITEIMPAHEHVQSWILDEIAAIEAQLPVAYASETR